VGEPPTGALGFGDALGDGLALGLAVTLACASPPSIRLLAAVKTIRAGQRPKPGGSFRFNGRPPRQIRVTIATRCQGGGVCFPDHEAMAHEGDDNDVTFIAYVDPLLSVRQG